MRKLPSIILAAALGATAHAASDVQLTFNDDGGFSYQLTSVSSTDAYSGTLPAGNPTINLYVGTRYGITVVNSGSHPVQIIGKAGTFTSDVALLSQGGTSGTFESDVDVNWQDLGGGLVEFTMTKALYDAMIASANNPGYRCIAHPGQMRGNFNVFGGGDPIADPIPATIPEGEIDVDLEEVLTGLVAPLGMDDAGDGRVFIYDQAGLVTLLLNGTPQATPFLDVSARLVPLEIINGNDINFDERGLLGFALHPDFTSNGLVYTYTSEPEGGTPDFSTVAGPNVPDHQTVIAEWEVSSGDSNVIDTGTRREILRIDQPQFNHDGGQLAFGPDGMLYISLGDGGGADDQDGISFIGLSTFGHGPDGNGQDKDNVFGTVLRIDVAGNNSVNGQYGVPASNPFVGGDGVDEVWVYGLRNPYRFSFDSATGDLYVADVGQNDIEEINIFTGGDNGGWRLKEGSFFFDPADAATPGFVTTAPVAPIPGDVVDPIAEYDHDEGIAIVGGYVYHGTAIPELAGKYVFGEFGSFSSPTGRLFYLDTGNVIKEFPVSAGAGRNIGKWIKGFGQDADGEVYIFTSEVLGPTGTTGAVYKLIAATPSAVDSWALY